MSCVPPRHVSGPTLTEVAACRNIHIMVTSVFLMLASVLGLVEEFGYKTVRSLPPTRACGFASCAP
jgi:hypothetical protein